MSGFLSSARRVCFVLAAACALWLLRVPEHALAQTPGAQRADAVPRAELLRGGSALVFAVAGDPPAPDLSEICQAIQAGVEKNGAPPYCARSAMPRITQAYVIKYPPPNRCYLKAVPGVEPFDTHFVTYFGREWREWMWAAFRLEGENCQGITVFGRAAGVGRDSGWHRLVEAVPGATYFISYSWPVSGMAPPDGTKGRSSNNYPSPGTDSFVLIACKHGTPLNSCARNTPSDGLPRANAGWVPEMSELASASANPNERVAAAHGNPAEPSLRLESLLEAEAKGKALASQRQAALPRSTAQAASPDASRQQCDRVWKESDQEVRRLTYDISFCSQYRQLVDHYRQLGARVVAACGGPDSFEGRLVRGNLRQLEENLDLSERRGRCR